MPHNQSKKYNSFLDIIHLNSYERDQSLRMIFDRDIKNNTSFKFRGKTIRPLKTEGEASLDVLYDHLTRESFYDCDKNGKKIKRRKEFDFDRSKRLHWILHHINQCSKDCIETFSYMDRINGKNVVRTYIFDKKENYVIILEPQRSETDYYLITAYYLKKEKGGVKQIKNKFRRKLEIVY